MTPLQLHDLLLLAALRRQAWAGLAIDATSRRYQESRALLLTETARAVYKVAVEQVAAAGGD